MNYRIEVGYCTSELSRALAQEGLQLSDEPIKNGSRSAEQLVGQLEGLAKYWNRVATHVAKDVEAFEESSNISRFWKQVEGEEPKKRAEIIRQREYDILVKKAEYAENLNGFPLVERVKVLIEPILLNTQNKPPLAEAVLSIAI